MNQNLVMKIEIPCSGLLRKMAVFLALALAIPGLAQDAPPQQESVAAEASADEAEPAENTANPEDTDTSSAYIKPPEPPLPEIPPSPVLPEEGYPTCREEHEQGITPVDRAGLVNDCTNAVDRYYNEVLIPFRQQMIEYQNSLSSLYSDKVAPSPGYSGETKDGFFEEVMRQHGESNPDGGNMAEYRVAEARYHTDRTYLQDRYCFNTGCGGYPVPDFAAAEKKKRKMEAVAEAEAEAANEQVASGKAGGVNSCKKARKRGSALGGLLGGVAGNVAGLGTVGTLLAGGFSGLLVGEIACKLTQDEQEVAAEATVAVTEKEEVGATAEWVSPTRSGVSGSSTVTALNTEPNGKKCLTITDVAIIDGAETRISKQMCRGRGDSGYAIAV